MISATNVVADDVASNAEVGAHVLAIGRHASGYAILPSEDHDATIGQVRPDDLSIRKVPRQSDRIQSLVSPRPKLRPHSQPPGFDSCCMQPLLRAFPLDSHYYHSLPPPLKKRHQNNQ